MSANVILSFFKKYKVDYAFKKNEQKVLFPCLYCSSTVEMCTLTTYWSCNCCNHSGNLLILIKYFNEGNTPDSKVYNPQTEQLIISNQFKSIIKKHPTLENDLVELENRVFKLITQYKKA